MVFGCFDRLSVEYCYQCMHGPDGCMVPSRHGEGTDIRAYNEELEIKLRPLAKKQHLEIENELANEKKNYGLSIKILILGGPSSGKSTIFKQMQIIHVDGFKKPQELLQYRGLIDSNIRDIYLQFIGGSRILNISLESIQHILFDIDDLYKEMSNDFAVRTTPDLCEALTEFWNSEPIQDLFRRRCEFELMDSTKYMIDVGGQRSERNKWLHLFDDVKVVLFVIDLTGYAKRSDESRLEVFMQMFT
uniref:Uncharacterized protein n=1 Tax=Caenorhabditis japonica TaxID=281687 RepID=A0A8R1DVC0_CAEJA